MSTVNLGATLPTAQPIVAPKRGEFLERYFYFLMALLIPAIVAFGFSFTIGRNLIHPVEPRPLILYVHAAVFTGWLMFFLLQSALVRTHNVKLHRKIGWFGAAFGASVPVVGTATSIAMARFNITQLHQERVESFLIVPLWDMVGIYDGIRAGGLFPEETGIPQAAGADRHVRADRGGFRALSAVSSESELFLCRSGFADSVGSGEGLDRLQKNPSGLSVCAADGSHRAIRRHVHLYPRPGVLGENRARTCELNDTSQLAVYQMSFSSL
ncbi:MAG TPA: hypothetical protein VFN20_07490 [Candidatus Acidoferrum sp.]|nr:hypothetical protein [Candidatus Acidoferrum sp.]